MTPTKPEVDDGLCKAHSGLVNELKDIKWVIGILIFIAGTTAAFLWHSLESSTAKLSNALEQMEKTNMIYRERISDKIDMLLTRTNGHQEKK